MQRESIWQVIWDPAGESPRVLLDYGDVMEEELRGSHSQLMDLMRYDFATQARPYGRGNRRRRLKLVREVPVADALALFSGMFTACAEDPWGAKALVRVRQYGEGPSVYLRAALLNVDRLPLETTAAGTPGWRETVTLRVNSGLTDDGAPISITGGWYNPPVVGGGTTSGSITIILAGTSSGLQPGDVVKVTGVTGVADGSYPVTGVSTSGGNTQVEIDAPSNQTSTLEGDAVTGISQDGLVHMQYPACQLRVEGMTDGATYTYKINGVGPAAISPDTFGRAVVALGTRDSIITYHDWEHTALNPLPIDGNKHSPGLGPPDFLVEETGPSGWTVELFRNGVLKDSQSVVPSWSTSKSWDTGHPAAEHFLTAPGGVTFTLHGDGGTDRYDTGIGEQITGGTITKQA